MAGPGKGSEESNDILLLGSGVGHLGLQVLTEVRVVIIKRRYGYCTHAVPLLLPRNQNPPAHMFTCWQARWSGLSPRTVPLCWSLDAPLHLLLLVPVHYRLRPTGTMALKSGATYAKNAGAVRRLVSLGSWGPPGVPSGSSSFPSVCHFRRPSYQITSDRE